MLPTALEPTQGQVALIDEMPLPPQILALTRHLRLVQGGQRMPTHHYFKVQSAVVHLKATTPRNAEVSFSNTGATAKAHTLSHEFGPSTSPDNGLRLLTCRAEGRRPTRKRRAHRMPQSGEAQTPFGGGRSSQPSCRGSTLSERPCMLGPAKCAMYLYHPC